LTEPEKVIYPEDIEDTDEAKKSYLARLLKEKEDITTKLTKLSLLDSQKLEIKLIEEESNTLKSSIKDTTEKVKRYETYAQLMNRTGKVYEAILKKLSQIFSSEDFKYDTDSGVFRNAKYLELNQYMKVKKKFRPYDQLSDGQKTMCDLDFLNNLYSVNMGLLCLDEHLKHLDENNVPLASKILSDLNVNTLIVSSHEDNYTEYTKKINLSLNELGETEYVISQ